MGLIPDVLFVEGDLIAFQQAAVFILEGYFAVMLGLVADVGDDGFGVGLADGKGGVSGLPMEAGELGAFGFDPFGGTGFYRFHDFGNGAGAGKAKKHVDVIVDSADLERGAINVVECASEAGVQFVGFRKTRAQRAAVL